MKKPGAFSFLAGLSVLLALTVPGVGSAQTSTVEGGAEPGGQPGGIDCSQGALLHELTSMTVDRPGSPELGIVRYLVLTLLQEPDVQNGDLSAACNAVKTLQSSLELVDRPLPSSFEGVRPLMEEGYEPVNQSIREIQGPSDDVWTTSRVLLTTAIQRWGTRVGNQALQMAEAAGQDQEIKRQLDGFRLAESVFETVDSPARAEAAKAQREILEEKFQRDIRRAENIHTHIEDLAGDPPSTFNLVGSILWYDEAGDAREDAPRAQDLYGLYGKDEERSEVQMASQDLARVQDGVRSDLLQILIPLHVVMAVLAGGVIVLLQRWEEDVEDVMLGTEIALLRGMQR